MFVIGHKSAHQVLHSDGVISRHHNLRVRNPDVNIVDWNCCEPALPLRALLVIVPVVNLLILWELNSVFLHLFSNPQVENLTAHQVRGATDRPCKTEHEDRSHLLRKCINLLLFNEFDLRLVVLSKVTVKQAHA